MSDGRKQGTTFGAIAKFWIGMAQAGADSVGHFLEDGAVEGAPSRQGLVERSAAAFSTFFNQAQTIAKEAHDALKSDPRQSARRKRNGVRIVD